MGGTLFRPAAKAVQALRWGKAYRLIDASSVIFRVGDHNERIHVGMCQCLIGDLVHQGAAYALAPGMWSGDHDLESRCPAEAKDAEVPYQGVAKKGTVPVALASIYSASESYEASLDKLPIRLLLMFHVS